MLSDIILIEVEGLNFDGYQDTWGPSTDNTATKRWAHMAQVLDKSQMIHSDHKTIVFIKLYNGPLLCGRLCLTPTSRRPTLVNTATHMLKMWWLCIFIETYVIIISPHVRSTLGNHWRNSITERLGHRYLSKLDHWGDAGDTKTSKIK